MRTIQSMLQVVAGKSATAPRLGSLQLLYAQLTDSDF